MPVNFRAIVRAYVNSDRYRPTTHGEYKWARTCARKVWFKKERQAARNAAWHGFVAYKCGYCSWWHVARRHSEETER